MKRIVLASLIFSFALAVMLPVTMEAAAAKPKPIKGKIVSLDDVIKGKKNADLQLTKERAKTLVEQGSPLVFLYNKKIYYIMSEGGDFAFKKLADFAHRTLVAITGGKPKTISGVNYIVMSSIEAAD